MADSSRQTENAVASSEATLHQAPTEWLLSFRKTAERSVRYLEETKRPLMCLIFVFPCLVFYEFGMLFSAANPTRNGIDQWLRDGFSYVGLEQLAVLPIATVATLLILHHRLHDRWEFRPIYLLGMVVESVALAFILLFAAKVQLLLFHSDHLHAASIGSTAAAPLMETIFVSEPRLYTFCGSGLYEEFVFRVLLFPLSVFLVTLLTIRPRYAQWIGALLVSVIFAWAHGQVAGEAGGGVVPFASFIVHFVASLFFCFIYRYRGFGIAVGTHAAYNVLTIL